MGQKGSIKKFYVKRVFRIVPVYYAILLLRFIVLPQIFSSESSPFQQIVGSQIWYWLFGNNILVVQLGRHPDQSLAHLWYVAVLVQFIVIWPFIVWVFKRKYLPWFCFACLILSLTYRIYILDVNFESYKSILSAYLLLPSRVGSLAVGALAASVIHKSDLIAVVRPWLKLVMVMCVFILVTVFILMGGLAMSSWEALTFGMTMSSVFWVSWLLVIVSGPAGGVCNKILANPCMRFIAKYSYGMYIFHLPLISIMKKAAGHIPQGLMASSVGQVAVVVMLITTCVLLSMIAAFISWHIFEKHIIGLGKRFA